MNGVMGMMALLLDTELTDEQRDYVESARSSSEALLRIINDVLDFSKIESGKLEFESHPFELHTCIEEALELVAPKALEKKLDLVYTVDESIPKILVSDVTRLRQILVNLIGNAVKFTHEGEVTVEVTPAAHGTRKREPGQELDTDFVRHPHQWLLHFAVRDTGIGIPPGRQDRLFKIFQQVDPSTTRHYGGTGLGLAICKSLAELMGGKIWVESDAGKGSTFHFTILTKASAPSTMPAWQAAQPRLQGRRLLVIEDNATNRELIRSRATQWGMSVEVASDANQALQMIDGESRFDTALLDMQLPDMDGWSLAHQIRQRPHRRHLPLLLLSAVRSRGEDLRAQPGVQVFVYKPVRPVQLLEALYKALNIHVQREKRAPAAPALDPEMSRRIPLRILLADDNPINLKVGLSVLRKLGYQADVAQNGSEVLNTLEQRTYDILFLDVQMPELDGLEAARQICQKWPVGRRPRIVAMTGNALTGDREKCLSAGMDDYISKPVRVEELQAALERWAPSTPRKNDTAFFRRQAEVPIEDLLDESMIEELKSLSPGDGANVLLELIDLFLHDAPQRVWQLSQALSEPEKLGFHAQALRSMCLNLGAKRMVELCRTLEEAASSGDLTHARTLVNQIEAAFNQTKAHLLRS